VGLGLLLAAGGIVTHWLLGDFGVPEQKAEQKARVVAAPSPSPTSLAPAPDASVLPLEPRLPPLTKTQNILIAGMDRRPGTKGIGLTDTLVVVVLEKRTGRVGLISIPRDIAVDVPNHGLDRINTVYSMAQAHGENALMALKQSVGDLLSLTIEHAIVVDLSVFEQLIDTLGGVSVNVPCPIIDDFADSRTPDGRRVLDVKEGQVRMDGATAAMYVRSRHGRSDFSRARRQQSVLNAIHRELLKLGNLGRLPEALSTIEHSVSTDFKRYELLDLARRALSVREDLVHGMVVSEKEVEPLLDQGRAMLSPNLDAIHIAVTKLFSAPPPGANHQEPLCPPADIALRRKNRRSTSADAGTEIKRVESDDNVEVTLRSTTEAMPADHLRRSPAVSPN
jgi:LCP family protein required for cell wall assembly